MSSHGKKFSNKDSLDYLKQFDISSVLSMALGELYLAKPKNQLYFLGNWLINHSNSQKNHNDDIEKTQLRETLQIQYQNSLELQRQTEETLKKEAEKLKQKEFDLKSELSTSLDIPDLFPKLIEHLKSSTLSAAGYIGLLEKVKRPVTDHDDDKAHIEDEAPLVLRYIATSENSHWMLNQILKEEEGQATWTIWKEDEEDPVDEEGQEPIAKPKLKILCVDDVVNDSRIKFFDVPKLGAYLAAPVTYASCLFESSFDAGVEDALECRKKRLLQEEERVKYESERKEDEEEKVFEEIKEERFRTSEVRIVIALDTLGMDKVFGDQQKEYVIDWAVMVKEQLQRAEEESLRRDVRAYVEIKDADAVRVAEKGLAWADEERDVSEAAVKALGLAPAEDLKQLVSLLSLFELFKERVKSDMQNLFKFKSFRVLKFARVFQLAFYLQGIDKERLVEPGTNMMLWKKGKEFLNSDFEEFIKNLHPQGPKPHKCQIYAKAMRLEKDLLKIPFEEVNGFSVSLGFLYKFLEFYLKARILDVIRRRKEFLTKVEAKEVAENAAKELHERKKKYVEDAQEAFEKEFDAALDEHKPVFDAVKVMDEFDGLEGNLPVQIPDAPVGEVDEDIDWEESNPSA